MSVWYIRKAGGLSSILTLKTKPYVAQDPEYSGIITGPKNPQERSVLSALVKWRH